jgi:hypothetical protein
MKLGPSLCCADILWTRSSDVLKSLDLWASSVVRNSDQLGNATFRKQEVFPPSGEEREATSLLGPLERPNPSHWSGHFMLLCFVLKSLKANSIAPTFLLLSLYLCIADFSPSSGGWSLSQMCSCGKCLQIHCYIWQRLLLFNIIKFHSKTCSNI